MRLLTAIIALALWPVAGLAHPGPLDPYGCHFSEHQGYHCHR